VPDEPVDERTPLSAVVHHPRFGLALKDRMDKLGIECIVHYPGGSSQGRMSKIEFIRKHFERVNTPKCPPADSGCPGQGCVQRRGKRGLGTPRRATFPCPSRGIHPARSA